MARRVAAVVLCCQDPSRVCRMHGTPPLWDRATTQWEQYPQWGALLFAHDDALSPIPRVFPAEIIHTIRVTGIATKNWVYESALFCGRPTGGQNCLFSVSVVVRERDGGVVCRLAYAKGHVDGSQALLERPRPAIRPRPRYGYRRRTAFCWIADLPGTVQFRVQLGETTALRCPL